MKVLKAIEIKNTQELRKSIASYNELLSKNKLSPRALFQKAETLDSLAQIERSNYLVEQSIATFHKIISLNEVPDTLFSLAGKKCVELLKFRGWYDNAIEAQKLILARFPDSIEDKKKLGTLLLYANKNEEAKILFEELIKENSNDGYSLVHLGFIWKSEGSMNPIPGDKNNQMQITEKLKRGAEYIRKGLNTRDIGVKEGKFYFHLGDALRRLGKSHEADEAYREAANEGAILSFWQRSLYNVEGLKAKPIWNPNETGIGNELNKITQDWQSIKKEALEILSKNLFHTEGENLIDTGKWAQYELYRQGKKNEKNCKNAPITCNLIESVPQIAQNRRGQVKFSIMEAGTHVHSHSGPTNCRLRVHLGLKIPKDTSPSNIPEKKTKLRVADQYVTWKNGEMFIFDDSFDHEVWHDNPQKESRIVLILDLWHPELTEHQKITLPAI